ncbi:hypothetical protein BKA65DRAFT_405938 [Rhexocercosporidium sp. MPI-PUGE-AT-0058]|nr:hypothetical protein BKA65DRAFT_405938 [Rhexocercosporidium sp. MPI-PUGE-AT-0058]
MPKDHRSVRSQGYYRLSPATTSSTLPTQYAPISARQTIPNTYYTTPQGPLTSQSMSQQSYTQQGPSGYSNGGPVQLPLSNQQQYAQMPQPMSIRASSGAWTPQDDQTLMAARAQGMNWAPIQQSYFPTKTPNACRKRHERLMERRSADDWDGVKLENLAKNYMGMRREIWSALAAQTGEKWNVVEQKCMSHGLKNLQTAARSCARRERMLDPSSSGSHPHPSQGGYTGYEAHTDDSGYADEQDHDHEHDLEAEYDADGASDRSSTNGVQVSYSHHGGHGHGMSSGGHYHSHSHSNGSNGSMNGMGAVGGMVGGGMGGYGMHQGRLPSMDMGIDAIINRPPGRQ